MYKITHIQLFDYAEKIQIDDIGNYEIKHSYSANLIINDKFVAQISGDNEMSSFSGIADPVDAFFGDEDAQEWAFENINASYLESALEEQGFENNIGWLEDQPMTETMNLENAQYRI